MKRFCFLVLALFTFESFASDNLMLRYEAKLHYRDSESKRFAVNFPFPPEALPVGESSAFVETVDAGSTFEISTLNIAARYRFSDQFNAHFRVDVIDKYDRNPTSSDQKIDLDHGFLRFGTAVAPLSDVSDTTYYAQIGKFAKFERQTARRTESYGLLSTAFNRFEDAGLEAGWDFANGVYTKVSWTTGNPVFLRDPNALAGDNGSPSTQAPPENPDPEFKSGIVMLYDAEVEDFDLGGESEKGAALGYRWSSADAYRKLDVMLFGHARALAEERDLNGTVYGGDLDLFDLGEVPGAGGIRLPAEGNDKREVGLNIWYEQGGFASFFQYVDQEMAELGRDGFEWEISYVFGTKQPLTPVLRYSQIDNDFVGSPLYPAPSVWWDWSKIDVGLNWDLTSALRVTLEHSTNQVTVAGDDEDFGETLLTFRWSDRI